MLNPYEVLGVPVGADLETAKKAYKRLARIHHPDLHGDPEKFKAINEAYSMIESGKVMFVTPKHDILRHETLFSFVNS